LAERLQLGDVVVAAAHEDVQLDDVGERAARVAQHFLEIAERAVELAHEISRRLDPARLIASRLPGEEQQAAALDEYSVAEPRGRGEALRVGDPPFHGPASAGPPPRSL